MLLPTTVAPRLGTGAIRLFTSEFLAFAFNLLNLLLLETPHSHWRSPIYGKSLGELIGITPRVEVEKPDWIHDGTPYRHQHSRGHSFRNSITMLGMAVQLYPALPSLYIVYKTGSHTALPTAYNIGRGYHARPGHSQ